MNLLSLVTPWLDNVCQIKPKCYSIKNKNFYQLNKTFVVKPTANYQHVLLVGETRACEREW